MEKQRLKKELIQKISECEDAAVLKRVEEMLLKVSEAEEQYVSSEKAELSEEIGISARQEEELMRRYNDHLQNKGRSISWEEVKQNLQDFNDV